MNWIGWLKNATYWLRTHTINKYHIVDTRCPDNGYSWGWIDADHKILLAVMAIFVDFIEKEKPFDTVDWSWNAEVIAVRHDFSKVYKYWKETRPLLVKRASDPQWWDHEINETIARMDEDAMSTVIRRREFMWT
jgi:hypothetical protein